MKFLKWLYELFTGWKKKSKKKDKPNPPAIEKSTHILHSTSLELFDWPEVSKLFASVSGGLIHLDTDRRDLWQNIAGTGGICGELFAFVFRDGYWHGGPCDGVYVMPSLKPSHSACVPDGDVRRFVPDKGERVKLRVAGCSRNGRFMTPKQWTEEVEIVWPYEAYKGSE